MPYITLKERRDLDQGAFPSTPGQLNYVITKALDDHLTIKGLSYSTINEIVGVLECAKQEFYRRIAATYENKKMEINGDAYHEDNVYA